MRYSGLWVLLCLGLAVSGCAAGLVGSADPNSEVRLLADSVASVPRVVLTAELEGETNERPGAAAHPQHELAISQNDPPPPQAPSAAIELTIDDSQPVTCEAPFADSPRLGLEPPAAQESQVGDTPSGDTGAPLYDTPLPNEPSLGEAVASDDPPPGVLQIPQPNESPVVMERGPIGIGQGRAGQLEVVQKPAASGRETRGPAPPAPHEIETVITPAPVPRSPFRPGDGEDDHDRFTRQVVDVPLDIRPTEGAMPQDLAAAQFAGEPTIDETFPGGVPADISVSHTPWTFCYRPLYFEDIKLERYGENVGYAQTGLSGVRFFGSILALPYKMTNRPPRSCQCSNGFSRCGDCPLPGYGRREFRIDASLIEAAAVAGVVYFLP